MKTVRFDKVEQLPICTTGKCITKVYGRKKHKLLSVKKGNKERNGALNKEGS